MPFGHITVCLAHRAPDAELLRYAAAAARLGGMREVRFVHVLAPREDGGPDEDPGEVLKEVRAAAGREFDAPASVRRSHEVLQGPVLDSLLQDASATDTDLLLVGHRADRPRRRSLARRLAMKAPCSVWMAPGGSPARLGRILAPVDYSERSADALRVAAALAARAGLRELTALHVYFDTARVGFEGGEQVLEARQREEFDRFVAGLDTQGVAVIPRFVNESNAAHAITRTAGEIGADLIVLATRGRTRSASILLGSVAEETLIESDLPVLTVKHFGAQLGALRALLERTEEKSRRVPFQ